MLLNKDLTTLYFIIIIIIGNVLSYKREISLVYTCIATSNMFFTHTHTHAYNISIKYIENNQLTRSKRSGNDKAFLKVYYIDMKV